MQFELVSKYRNKLFSYARKYNVPADDVIQEARIIEWRMNKYSPTNRISYFLNSVQHQTIKLANFCEDSLEELGIVEKLVDPKTFHRWYEIYIYELADMLGQVDEIMCEMFLMKVSYDLSWASMRRERFAQLAYNDFWEYVKFIKFKVKDYIQADYEQPLLSLVECI